jgi:hypothetical protein
MTGLAIARADIASPPSRTAFARVTIVTDPAGAR